MTFGDWLAKRRAQAGLTQKELAAKCNLSPTYIARLELGSLEPPPRSTCKPLARALGISFEEIWTLALLIRLRRWLNREGYPRIPEAELLDFVKKIESTG